MAAPLMNPEDARRPAGAALTWNMDDVAAALQQAGVSPADMASAAFNDGVAWSPLMGKQGLTLGAPPVAGAVHTSPAGMSTSSLARDATTAVDPRSHSGSTLIYRDSVHTSPSAAATTASHVEFSPHHAPDMRAYAGVDPRLQPRGGVAAPRVGGAAPTRRAAVGVKHALQSFAEADVMRTGAVAPLSHAPPVTYYRGPPPAVEEEGYVTSTPQPQQGYSTAAPGPGMEVYGSGGGGYPGSYGRGGAVYQLEPAYKAPSPGMRPHVAAAAAAAPAGYTMIPRGDYAPPAPPAGYEYHYDAPPQPSNVPARVYGYAEVPEYGAARGGYHVDPAAASRPTFSPLMAPPTSATGRAPIPASHTVVHGSFPPPLQATNSAAAAAGGPRSFVHPNLRGDSYPRAVDGPRRDAPPLRTVSGGYTPPQQPTQGYMGYAGGGDGGHRPSTETRAYREHEWQLLRVLVIRRFHGLTHKPEHAALTPGNLRCAMILFGIPTTVLDLVSRPHAPRSGASPMLRREPIPEPLTPGDDVNLCLPNDLVITDADLARIPCATLPEEALGWWPSGGAAPLPGGGRDEFDVVPTGADDGSLVPSEHTQQQQLIAAATIAAMAAELVARRRFKTKLCHAWMRSGGHCPRGSNCDYAHGADELRQVGEPRDGRFKSKLCRSFLDSLGTFCGHGDRCSFAHGVHELRIRVPDSLDEVEDAIAAMGEAGPDERSPAPGVAPGGASPLSMGGTLRRFKPMLCREWLQGAADASAAAAMKIATGGTPLRIDPARAGARRCRKGAMCPNAHGLSELRLPSVVDQVKLIQALAGESPHAAPGVALNESLDHPLSLRDQTLLLVASGLLAPCLPPPLLHRITSASALMGRAPIIPSSGILPDFEGMPEAVGKAMTAAIHNPMLQVVLPYATAAASTAWGGGFDVSASPAGSGPRMGLAKIIATVGNDAADAALVTAAVAMGAVRLPALLTPTPAAIGDAEDAMDPRISMATGRYGALMRRRMELQTHVAASSGSPPQTGGRSPGM